ncbi:GMC family oxidoreductase [Phenylobacterium sp.]|uniref:GMC family oxidoreductase n=1 Tax=Phenylobacterium sp. TaxID=1871053 RepID=UPI002EDA352E
MHRDLNHAEGGGQLETEICVIGCGAAGITAARRLLELGHTVVLLESGGLDYERATADLNAGENIGQTYYDLADARLRFFGGTTAIWGGRVAELDPIDLEQRAWVPNSGWPIGWNDLERYYAPARRIFGEPPAAASTDDLRRAGAPIPDFEASSLEIGVWTFDRRFDRFVFDACADLVRHPRCTIVTHATVTEIDLDANGWRVRRVVAQSLSRRRLGVRARAVMLAAGGLENPRLLLASNEVARHGIGNDHDQVGRYFMEHPHARGGRVVGASAWRLLKAFGRTHRLAEREIAGLIKPSVKLQTERRILNSSLTIVARQPAAATQNWGALAYSQLKHGMAPTRFGRRLWMATKSTANWVQQRTDPLRPWLLHHLGLRDLSLLVRAEQAPNPQSRVLLTNQRDPLGVPRLALDWRTTALDIDSVAGLVDALDRELRRLGLGRVEASDWLSDPASGWRTDPLISSHPIGGYHHMGTTRMSDDPRTGVTDPSGRVHGVQNLYVVGSSVFPTSGWANPTLTIAALALRTSDTVSERLARVHAA